MAQNIDGLPKVYLFRTGVQVSSPKGSPAAMGERGILVVGNVTYYTIERSGNYVMLPKGVFMCWMQLIHPNTKSEKRAFLVKQTGEYGHNKNSLFIFCEQAIFSILETALKLKNSIAQIKLY